MDNLPLVNVFEFPYELWETRDQTLNEAMQSGKFHQMVKVKLDARIENHVDAAKHILLNIVDNQIEAFIKDYLNGSSNYKNMRNKMPSTTPKSLSDYQRKFKTIGFDRVSIDINDFGEKLSDGQYLFHGGQWPSNAGESFITSRPFSTSFCPQIALRNAEWAGKAYDAGEVNLFVLRVATPQTKAFCFKLNGTDKGHEAEVLFASGAHLTLRNKTLIKDDGTAFKACNQIAGRVLEKQIPYHLLEVDIS